MKINQQREINIMTNSIELLRAEVEMKEQEIYYYSDELNDEFSGSHITPRVIDEKYK